MTMSEPRKPPVSRKSKAGQVILIIVLLLIVRFLWLRDQPERLMNAPGSFSTISGDYFYTEDANPLIYQNPADRRELTIHAQSIHGGGLRTIAKEDVRYQFRNQGGGNSVSIVEGKIVYSIEPRPEPVQGGPWSVALGSADALIASEYLGTFLGPPKSPTGMAAAGQKRVRFGPFPARNIRFRQVSIQGGTSRDVATLWSAGDCLVGNHLFWIKPGPGERDDVTQENGGGQRTSWTEVSAESDLMLTSLTDGATRSIYHGIPRYASMTAGEAGMTWEQPAPFPGRPTVCYARVADGSVRALGTSEKTGYFSPIVEARGQLYWAVTHTQPNNYTVLMTAHKDGMGLREACTQVNRHPISELSLYAYQGNLYGSVVERRTASDGSLKRNMYLCRFHPERSDPIEIVHKLPDKSSSVQFDAGYFYFIRYEEKRTVWATLTNDDVGAEIDMALCRLPVDH